MSLRGFINDFVQVVSSNAIAAAAGATGCMVLKEDGGVWASKSEHRAEASPKRQRNDAKVVNEGTFSFVQIIPGAKTAAVGSYHNMILTKVGRVWATDWNKYGQLGDGTLLDKTTYIRVVESGATAVAAGDMHSIVLKEDGTVWTAGGNLSLIHI